MISRLLDPMFLGLMVVLVGLAGWTWHERKRGWRGWHTVVWAGFLMLWLCASPWFANIFVRWLEPEPPDLAPLLDGVEPEKRALVILAGGLRNDHDFVPPPERLGDATQARLLGGARLYREHDGFGVVVVTGTGHRFVSAMADYLVLLGVPRDRIALETLATDTETNATHTAAILEKHAPKKVVLVTSAMHMPRSVAAFRDAGVEVVPAPVDYNLIEGNKLIPSARSMRRSARALHEILGSLEP